MTRFEYPDLEPELTLELARLTTEPGAGDKLRNFTALSSRLGLPVAQPPTATRPLSGSVARPQGLPAVLVGKAPWRQLVAVGVTTGAMGFLLGLRFEVAHSESQPFPAQSAPVAALAALDLKATSAGPVATQLAGAVENSAAPWDVASVAGDQTARPVPIEISRSTIAKRRHPRSPDTSASTTPKTKRSAAFLEAVQLLGRARRALDRGEAMLALGLLDEIDRRFPPDLLDEERGATRVLGLCASGESEAAVQLANRVFSGRPRSIYTRRIERSCASSVLIGPVSPEREH